MAIKVNCPSCRASFSVADTLNGKKIRCRECEKPVLVSDDDAGDDAKEKDKARITDRKGRPPVPAKTAAMRSRPRDDDDEEEELPRSRRGKKEPQKKNMMPVMLIGGGVAAAAIVGLVLFLVLGGKSSEATPVAQNPIPQNPMANPGNPMANPGNPNPNPPANVPDPTKNDPEPKEEPNKADPEPEPVVHMPTGSGERVYQRLLKSAVWILADQKIGGDGRVISGPSQPPQGNPGFPPQANPQQGNPGGNSKGSGAAPGGAVPGIGGRTIRAPRITPTPRPGGTRIIRIRVRNDSEVEQGLIDPFQLGGVGVGVAPPGISLPGGVKPPTNIPGAPGAMPPGSAPGTPMPPTGFPGGAQPPGGFPTPPGGFPGGAKPPGGFPMPPGGFPGGAQPPGGFPTPPGGFPGGAKPPGGMPGGPGGEGPGGGSVKSTGTGSLIDRKHRLIITNVHVVGNAEYVTLHFPTMDKGKVEGKRDYYLSKPGIRGKVVAREDRADIALVQLDSLPDGVQVLALAKKSARPAQQVHSIGNPGASGALWVYSPGQVRQVFPDEWQSKGLEGVKSYKAMKVETNSAINPGDSGGPLVDDRGVIVGIAHGGNMRAQNMSIFIDVSECRMLMEKYYKSIKEQWVPEPEPAVQEDVAQLPLLLKKLNHKDFSVRLQAAQTLGKMGPDANLAFGPLFNALKDSETLVRRAAAEALDRIPPHRADLPMLCDACKNQQEPMEVRLQAIRSLGTLGPQARAALPVLVDQLKASDENLRQTALKAFLTIGPEGKDVPVLTDAMKSGNGEVRQLAINALIKLGPDSQPAVPMLTGFVKKSDRNLRIGAARVLEAIGPSAKAAALPVLAEAMKDADQAVAMECLSAYLKLGGETKEAMGCLNSAVRNGAGEARKKALQVLAKVGSEARSSVPLVLACLDNDDVRGDARNALIKITKPLAKSSKEATLKLICKKLIEEMHNAKARKACIEALAEIGHATQPVAQALAILYNRDSENRKAALAALQQLNIIAPGTQLTPPNNGGNTGGGRPGYPGGGINPGGRPGFPGGGAPGGRPGFPGGINPGGVRPPTGGIN